MTGLRKWLAENRNDKVLIFDLRNHHGGGLDEQDAIFSYVFREEDSAGEDVAVAQRVQGAGLAASIEPDAAVRARR